MHLFNAQLVLPEGVARGSVSIAGGRIGRVVSRNVPSRKGGVNCRGFFLAPGLVDLHIHGALGRDTMEATEEAFRTITGYHLEGGTTSIALTTVTAAEADILPVLEAVKRVLGQSLGGSRIIGVHVEGPFISAHKAGAQNPAQIRPPAPAEWKKYLRYGKLVTEMTVAPEIPGALPLIRALRRNGSLASGGHTNATEAELEPALEAGLNHATHTFNAMSTATKFGPYRRAGMLEFALAHDEICCELIADGEHVTPTLMKMLLRAKGVERVCLITDAMAGAGLPPGTIYRAGGSGALEARVTENAALTIDGAALAGSTLTMIQAVKRVCQMTGVSLSDAVRMASFNPARQLGREGEIGGLAAGLRADLICFDSQFRMRAVWLDGELLLNRGLV